MKKAIYTILCLLPMAVAHAQPVINYEDHSMHPGDYNETVFTQYKTPGKGGEGRVWDFSGQKLINDHHAEVMLAEETPFNGDFPEANMAIKEHGNYFYFDVQPASSSYHGFVKNDNLVIKYDKGAEKMRYPFHYNDQYSGDFTAKTVVSNIYGNYRVHGDGYGTIKLPGGVVLHNVLRVKSTEDFVESACNAVHAHTEKYMWYHPDYRYPVYVMFYRKETYLDRDKPKVYEYGILNKAVQKRQKVASAREQKVQHKYRVMPNPFKDETRISYTLNARVKVRIEVFDMKGNRITVLKDKKQTPGNYQVTFNPSRHDAKPGSYLVKIMLGKQVDLEKLIYVAE